MTEAVPEFARIRLFVPDSLSPSATLELSAAQSHYIATVMRRRAADAIRLFNGRDGEWSATIAESSRKTVRVQVSAQTRPQDAVPDVTVFFAPVKKAPTEWLVEKATELGARRLQPVMTQRTQGHVSPERLRAHAVEAAEQSWRLSVPEIAPPAPLFRALESWPKDAPILYCDERGRAPPTLSALQAARGRKEPWGILVGPEGGFAPEEQTRLDAWPGLVIASLGPRIVRAETAAVMALTLWQSVLGDLA